MSGDGFRTGTPIELQHGINQSHKAEHGSEHAHNNAQRRHETLGKPDIFEQGFHAYADVPGKHDRQHNRRQLWK